MAGVDLGPLWCLVCSLSLEQEAPDQGWLIMLLSLEPGHRCGEA